MGFFSNLFKKNNNSSTAKPKATDTSSLITAYLNEKQENGKKLNAKDYFAKDLADKTAEIKFENALKNILYVNQVEPCGNATDISWSETSKEANISMMIFDFSEEINVILYVDIDENEKDCIEIWIGESYQPNASIDLDTYPENVSDSSCIYNNVAQKVKQYLQANKLV